MDVTFDGGSDLDNINVEEFTLLLDEELHRVTCADIDIESLDQLQCLGSPFFPNGEKHTCTCNEVIRGKYSGSRLPQKEAISLDYNKDNDQRENRILNEEGRGRQSNNKSIHVHDFLLELLNNGGYEAYIHWTVKERREFKIAKPQRIAALWGDRKSRKLLSDAKLARALRYSIKKGKLEKTDDQLMFFRFL